MIDGVVIKKLNIFKDVPDVPDAKTDAGFLMEVLRADDNLMRKFGQTVFTVTYKDTIKAFHWHKKQDDLWFVATGQARIVLYDQRSDSKTFKQTQVIKAGQDDYKLILIPAGVVHGYQVLSPEPVLLFYLTTELYDRENLDEQRIPYNDATINFDWSKV